jgi:gluconate:H+ symporter, GntP family
MRSTLWGHSEEIDFSMYGMPLAQALLFLTCVIAFVLATQWRPLHPFLVLVVLATAFGTIAGYPTSQLGSAFGSGFAEKFYSPGLVIVAAALIAGLAESTTASDRLMAAIDRTRSLGSGVIAAGLGLIAGLAASPAAAFALLTPLLRPIVGKGQSRERDTLAMALAISASHGLAVLTPVPIAAAAIIGADWDRVALFGVPLAVLLAAFGVLFARWASPAGAIVEPSRPQPGAEKPSKGYPLVLIAAIAIPLALLIVQSVGEMPSEPFGGGTKRELVIGVGRPLILFLVGVGIMTVGHLRRSFSLFADARWTGRIFGDIAGLLLIVSAAGGLQRLCQQTGMAEVLGERLLAWHLGPFGVLIPFLIAAVMKTLQGSSLVAAITAAGMVGPIVLPLGLADSSGKALAALAVGAGAMTVSHINDEYFWLVADCAGLTPLRGLARFSAGTLLQGLIAAAALAILASLVSHT